MTTVIPSFRHIFSRFKRHEHEWEVIAKLSHAYLERCECGDLQSSLWDYTALKWRTYEGNIISPLNGPNKIFVLCGARGEYIRAMGQMKPPMREYYTYLARIEQLMGVRNPVIVFIGTWWTSELLDHPYLTKALNGDFA